jgi:hypothetical protein
VARVVCDRRKCKYNDDDECRAATLHYANRLCMTYRPVNIEQVMQPDHMTACSARRNRTLK